MSLEQHRQDSKGPLGFAVITISDTRSAGKSRSKPDLGGDYLAETIATAGHKVTLREWTVDEPWPIEESVHRAVKRDDVDLVVTTGGTGVAPRDVTYPTLVRMFESEIPGFGELFRSLSFREIGSAALLSRAVGGILKGKVVLALPGSPKALKLAMEEIVLKEAVHLVTQVRGPVA
jgi:molybdenum cofactor biosynthesis protein B